MSRLHVPLTDRAAAGLHAAMELTGDDEATVTRKALVAYAELARLGQHEGVYDAELKVGKEPLFVAACRTAPKRRWRLW